MEIEKVVKYLSTLESNQKNTIKYKIIPSNSADDLCFMKSHMPKILTKDPLIRNHNLEKGDVVAILRDYEIGVTPYYYYRVVV